MPRIAKRTSTVQAHIDRLVQRIVKKFHPEQIILFGSHARGDAGPDSDIVLPNNSTQPDYEAEFAFVIGKGGFCPFCRHIWLGQEICCSEEVLAIDRPRRDKSQGEPWRALPG